VIAGETALEIRLKCVSLACRVSRNYNEEASWRKFVENSHGHESASVPDGRRERRVDFEPVSQERGGA